MSRFLGHQSRDVRIVDLVDGLADATSASTIKPRTDGIVHQVYAQQHGDHETSIASSHYRAAGVHLVGPNELGADRTLYRVVCSATETMSSGKIYLGAAIANATPGDTAAGQAVTKQTFLAFGLDVLLYDDLIAVAPFADADKDKAIVFFVAFHNYGSASATSLRSYSLNVRRLVEPAPAMFDQRIQ